MPALYSSFSLLLGLCSRWGMIWGADSVSIMTAGGFKVDAAFGPRAKKKVLLKPACTQMLCF